MENNLVEGTLWLCIDRSSEYYALTCRITEICSDDGCNGEGLIELQYEDTSVYYGKTRRFKPWVTHIYIGKGALTFAI